jgi:hypothetical protein
LQQHSQSFHAQSTDPTEPVLTIASTPSDLNLSNQRTLLRRLYKELPKKLKENTDLSLAALCCGCIAVMDLPLVLQVEPHFWKRILAVCPAAWPLRPVLDVNGAVVVDLVWALAWIPSVTVAREILNEFPDLGMNREFWLKVVSSPSFADSFPDYLEVAPDLVWLDQEIMVLAVRQNCRIYALLHERDNLLSEDRDVVVAALGQTPSPEALSNVSAWVQIMYPDIVATAISTCDTDDIWDIYDAIAKPLWQNSQIVYAWLSRGGSFLHEDFLPEMNSDAQAFMLIAQYCPQDFCYATHELRLDKAFLSKVLDVNPFLLHDFNFGYLYMFDLALIAFGGSASAATPSTPAVIRKRRDLIGLYDGNNATHFSILTDFAKYVHEKVIQHEQFVTLILGGIKFAEPPSYGNHTEPIDQSGSVESSCLAILNQGDETSLVYKRLLAEFVGIAVGNEANVLRQASINLARWGY